jgi:hypothetical protein
MILIVWQLDLQIPVQSVLIPLMLWVRIPLRWGVLHTTLYDKACQWLVTCRRFSLGTPVSSNNKTDRHDITEMLLQVALKSILLLLLLCNLLGWTLIIKLNVYLQTTNLGIELKFHPPVTNKCNYSVKYQKYFWQSFFSFNWHNGVYVLLLGYFMKQA